MGDPNAGQGLRRAAQVRWETDGRRRAEERARRAEQDARAATAAAMARMHSAPAVVTSRSVIVHSCGRADGHDLDCWTTVWTSVDGQWVPDATSVAAGRVGPEPEVAP